MTDPQEWAKPGARPPDPVPPDQPQGQTPPPQPGAQQPEYQQPGYQQPGYPQPGYPPPGSPQAGYQQPGYPPPGYPPPGSPQAGYQPPGYQQPGYPQAGPQQPGYPPPGSPQAGYPPPGYQYPGTQGGSGMPPGPPWGGVPAAPKPGVIPLRPLGVGEILDGAVSYIRANPVATLGLAAIVITISQLIQLPVVLLAMDQLRGITDDVALEEMMTAVGASTTTSLLAAFISFIATTVLSGMLIAVLSQAVLGRKMSIGEAWAAVRHRIPGLFGLSLLVALLLGVVIVVGVVPLVIAAIAEAPGALLLFLGLFVPASWVVALYFGVYWSLAAPAYVLEGVPVTAALRRSFQLVRTQWWRVFAILLLGGLIAVIISSILSVPFSLGATFLDTSVDPTDPFAGMSTLGLVITSVGTILASTVTAPFSAGISGLLYFDQRIRREALDIELARAAQQ
jgi:glycerophosphoryl diester phosphodiesterase family protein